MRGIPKNEATRNEGLLDLLTVIVLSRFIHPTSTGERYCAKLSAIWPAQFANTRPSTRRQSRCFPWRQFARLVGSERWLSLTRTDAVGIAEQANVSSYSPCVLESRTGDANVLSGYEMESRCLSLEALITTHDHRVRQQLSAELGISHRSWGSFIRNRITQRLHVAVEISTRSKFSLRLACSATARRAFSAV